MPHTPGPSPLEAGERDAYTSLSICEVTHKAALCNCALDRSIDDGRIRFYQCKLHATTPELVEACRKVLKNITMLIDGETVSRTQLKGRHRELTTAIAKAEGGG